MNNIKFPTINAEKLRINKSAIKQQFDLIYPLEDQKSFFIGISDYVQLIEKSDYLRAVVNASILEDRNKLIKEINEISEKSANESKATYKKLIATIKARKINNPNIQAEIQEYNDYLEGKIHISGSGNFATHICDFVRDIIISLKYNGYEDIANQYAFYGQTKEIITGWKISASEAEVDKILEKFKDKTDVSLWGAWEELWWTYATIQNKYEIWESMSNSDNTWDRLNFSGLIGDMKNILDGKTPDPNKYHYFEINKFKRHLARVNRHLETWLDDIILGLAARKLSAKPEVDSKRNISYNPNDSILRIDNTNIKIEAGSKQDCLCKIIFKDNESMAKRWDREEILEQWHEKGIDDLFLENGRLNPKFRRQVYNACDKLKIKIALKASINDLLVFDTQSVTLNSKYVS